ncbi:FimV/HubP family polar landmark protein [Marinobacterium rhizophilum]|uniref:FimV N-terminal domain-containing protein n=1 Tax=Marinobacterium rhizophilum TaxID=420402 RepID=A0ABY5HLY3_9GAMM|nr:FimV/HubP family polar landmark protein [Marinobacterium rhizophilum]UTW13268.1 hypothetical protein KDW95_06315 [Marinobacterium rhizophilum]
MWRKLALSLAVAGVLGASQAHALGLGQIRINSALNEPLDAEIQLLQVRDLDPLQVVPRMADQDQFAMAGIDRSRLLSDVQFQVNINQNGTGSIRMTSSRPVREPFLNLLVEVNWPNGRLVREYTVLLDPPAFQAAAIGGNAAPVPAQSTRAVVPAPQPVFAPPSRNRPPANNIRTNMNAQTQVFVETNDTLGGLAQRHSPGGGTSINQMMLALQRKNPHAFPSSNINFLKAGVVLDLPSLGEVQALNAREASNEVARQMQRWKAGTSAPAPGAAQEDGSKKKPLAPVDAQAGAATTGEGQLKILSATDQAEVAVDQDESGAGEVAETAVADPEKAELLRRNEELENRLAVTQESVDKIERENTELNDKLTAISQQMETLQRLLELKDQQMAALQDQLQQVQPAAAPPEPPAPVAPRGPSGLIETVLQTPAYMAGLGAVIGGLLVGLIALGRRRREDEVEHSDDAPQAKLAASPDADNAAHSALAGGAVAAGATAVWIADDEQQTDQDNAERNAAEAPEVAVSEDLDELDLDLDLDLADETPLAVAAQSTDAEPATAPARPLFDDDEFDLSLDTDFEENTPIKDQVANSNEEFDESLDDLLGLAPGDEAEAERADLRSGMGQLPGEVETFDEPEDTLESLGLDSVIDSSNVPKSAEEEVSDYRPGDKVEASSPAADAADADDDLDFKLDQVAPLDLSQDDDLIDLASGSAAGEPEQAPNTAPGDADAERPDAVAPPEPVAESSVPSDAGAEDALEFELDDALVFDPSSAVPADAPRSEVAEDAEPSASPLPDEPQDELDALLAESGGEADADDADEIVLAGDDEEDLDAMLAALGGSVDSNDQGAAEVSDGDDVDVSLDDDMDLDTELEALLGAVDDDIALDESGSDDEDRGFEDMGFLDGTDEVETKLDLARAYIDMEDRDGAKDILSEILSEGSDVQQQEARKLMESIA